MGRKYKFHDNQKLYFITLTVVDWVDLFIRKEYKEIIYDSLNFCQKSKGLEVYAYCIMTSHIHLIIGTEKGVLSDIIRDFKSFTSRELRKCVENNNKESRRRWLIWLFTKAGTDNKRNNDFQLWQQHNHPVQLNTVELVEQRLNYIHMNPVVAGFVAREEDWLDSSCADYYGKGNSHIELSYLY